MRIWDWKGANYSEDWSQDFFEIGGLQYDEEHEAYIVQDTEYCLDQAFDWKEEENRVREYYDAVVDYEFLEITD